MKICIQYTLSSRAALGLPAECVARARVSCIQDEDKRISTFGLDFLKARSIISRQYSLRFELKHFLLGVKLARI